jgi:ATP-dependent helicase/DNAse subunit B
MDTESFLAAEKILGIAGNSAFSILYKYLDEARKEPIDLLPSLFENRFSGMTLKGINSETRKIPYEIKIGGVIDRIDINDEEQRYKVIDYKSGKSDYSESDIRKGHKLQIPVYLMATVKNRVTELPKEHLYLHPRIFSLKYNESDFGKKDLIYTKRGEDTHEIAKPVWDDLLLITESFIRKYVFSMLNGEFPLSKEISSPKSPCSYCDLSALCRVKDYNVSQPSQDLSES